MVMRLAGLPACVILGLTLSAGEACGQSSTKREVEDMIMKWVAVESANYPRHEGWLEGTPAIHARQVPLPDCAKTWPDLSLWSVSRGPAGVADWLVAAVADDLFTLSATPVPEWRGFINTLAQLQRTQESDTVLACIVTVVREILSIGGYVAGPDPGGDSTDGVAAKLSVLLPDGWPSPELLDPQDGRVVTLTLFRWPEDCSCGAFLPVAYALYFGDGGKLLAWSTRKGRLIQPPWLTPGERHCAPSC